tara:strand:+ start:65 stop:307 length:243 start_codon:yes stop_codon:yes gene_type:complete
MTTPDTTPTTTTPTTTSTFLWGGMGTLWGWRIYSSDGQLWSMYCGTSSRTAARFGSWRRVEIDDAPGMVRRVAAAIRRGA